MSLTGSAARGSLDIDFSIEGDFEDVAEIERRIFTALRDRFDSAGFMLFDERFGPKPKHRSAGQDEKWGGYRAEFKLIGKDVAAQFGSNTDALRRNASVLGLGQERIFKIEISKFEYVKPKVETEFDEYSIYVYPPEMIGAEKLARDLPANAGVRCRFGTSARAPVISMTSTRWSPMPAWI